MPRSLPYQPALDGLRALAVAAVIAQHFGWNIIGFHGVTVFFVLSGYLITGLLLHEREQTGRLDLRAFWRRRFARLAPALVLAVVAIVLWLVATAVPMRQWFAGLLGSLTYSTDILEQTSWLPHVSTNFEWSWSLAAEEQFYLLWPALLALAFAGVRGWWRGRSRMALACLALVGVAWLLRWQMVASQAGPGRVNFSFESHVDALALGGLIAVLTVGRRVGRITRSVAAAAGVAGAVALLAVMLRGPQRPRELVPVDAGGYGVAALLAAVVVAGLVLAPRGWLARTLSARPLGYLGRLSYGLYLWNMLIKHIYQQVTGWDVGEQRWAEVIALGVLLGVCHLSYRYVEVPLRRRWAHRTVPTAAAAETPALALA